MNIMTIKMQFRWKVGRSGRDTDVQQRKHLAVKITLTQNHPTKKDSNPSNEETHSLSKLRNRQRQLIPNLISRLLNLLPDAQQDIRAALSEAEALEAVHL